MESPEEKTKPTASESPAWAAELLAAVRSLAYTQRDVLAAVSRKLDEILGELRKLTSQGRVPDFGVKFPPFWRKADAATKEAKQWGFTTALLPDAETHVPVPKTPAGKISQHWPQDHPESDPYTLWLRENPNVISFAEALKADWMKNLKTEKPWYGSVRTLSRFLAAMQYPAQYLNKQVITEAAFRHATDLKNKRLQEQNVTDQRASRVKKKKLQSDNRTPFPDQKTGLPYTPAKLPDTAKGGKASPKRRPKRRVR